MPDSKIGRHTMIAWVEDKPGVLNRVSGLFGRRNFNIESLTVGHSETPGVSRMTFVVRGTDRDIQQVRMQLFKLINVLDIQDLTDIPHVQYELALVKVRAVNGTRAEIMRLVDIFHADIVDVDLSSVTIRLAAKEDRINALLRLLEQFGILEMVRSGRLAMVRGDLPEDELESEPEMALAGNGQTG
ncbi:MAG: acetolactate synthase small subunit [Candidatus Promineifilaceae bacterium]